MDGFSHTGYGWIFGLILLTIAIGIFIMQMSKSNSDGIENIDDSAIDILKKRLAREEISQEEYNQIKSDLI